MICLTSLPTKRWSAMVMDVFNRLTAGWEPGPDRTYVAGTDTPPPGNGVAGARLNEGSLAYKSRAFQILHVIAAAIIVAQSKMIASTRAKNPIAATTVAPHMLAERSGARERRT
jgi:hypothetical protein